MKCVLDDIEINYKVYGEGKPVLMLHGSPVDHRIMLGCMEPIFKDKSGYKRIYMDLPGMGETKKSDFIKSLDDMLEVVIKFINKIIPAETFLLAGESYGGFLARGLVYKMPTKIDGLLLICPSIIREEKKKNLPEHVVLEKDDLFSSKPNLEHAEDFQSIQVVQNKYCFDRFLNEIMPAIEMADIDFLNNLNDNGYNFSYDIDDINEKFEKPTLILLGRQDSVVGYKDAWNILDKYPRATFAVLDKAGHNLQIEQAELFNALVKEWLSRTL